MANWSTESVVINTKEDCKNNVMKNLLSNQKGMALLTTLIFVFILITFGASLLIMTSNDTKLSTLQRDSTKAFYIAETKVPFPSNIIVSPDSPITKPSGLSTHIIPSIVSIPGSGPVPGTHLI